MTSAAAPPTARPLNKASYREVLAAANAAPARPYWFNIVIFGGTFALSAYTIVFHFSWQALLWTWLAAALSSVGLGIGYHRLLAHRSFETTPFVRRAFATLGLMNVNDRPAAWVAHHRIHHAYTETDLDVHSPNRGLFWAHIGWLLYYPEFLRRYDDFAPLCPDTLEDPYIRWLSRTYGPSIVFQLVILGSLYAIGGLEWVLWGGVVRVAFAWEGFLLINSFGHRIGYRRYETRDGSRNNPLFDLLSLGEGLHNAHHAQPRCARNSRVWWEIDVCWWIIRVLEALGLAWNVRRPRPGSGT